MSSLTHTGRIASAIQSLRLPPGTISTASVKHDAGCPSLKGCPVCRCVPDIEIQLPTGSVHVLPDGTIREPSTNN
jgi:hypothetical protein